MKDKCTFYKSHFEAIDQLKDKEQLALYKAIMYYQFKGVELELSGTAKILFDVFKPLIDRDDFVYDRYYGRSCREYKEWRENVLRRDGYVCQDCGKSLYPLHAHHIKPFAKYPDLRYEIGNGITLCEECHRKRHLKKPNKT